VIDDGRMTEAVRVWFILQYFGAEASILNGGWPAIRDREDLHGLAPNSGTPTKAELDSDVRISMPGQLVNFLVRISGAIHVAIIYQGHACCPIVRD